MVKLTSCIALTLLLLLAVIGVMARQEGDQKRKVPAMSSDDTDAAPSTRQPMAGSAAGATTGLARYSPESCGLSIELPREPHRFDISASAIEKQGMGSLRVYGSPGGDYTVSLRHYELPRHGQPSPEECIKTFFRAVSAAGIFIDLNYTLLDKSADRASFRVVSGEEQGRGWEGFALVQGRDAWIVFAVYPLAKSSAVQQVKSILGSARLDGPPCLEH
jgi:hypothetical protein